MMFVKYCAVLVVLLSVVGCSESERSKIISEIKEATMSEEEKRQRDLLIKQEQEREKMLLLNEIRYDIIQDRALVEIKNEIATHLHKKNIKFSDIDIYDIYTHYPDNAETPNQTSYTYKVDFNADVIYQDLFIKEIIQLSGNIEFIFYHDKENYKTLAGWSVVNKTSDFSDTAKDGAKFFFEKLTEQ